MAPAFATWLIFLDGQVFDRHASLVPDLSRSNRWPRYDWRVVARKDGGLTVGETADKRVICICLKIPDMYPGQQIIDGIRAELVGSVVISSRSGE